MMKGINGDGMVYNLHCYFASQIRIPERIRLNDEVDILFKNNGQFCPEIRWSTENGAIYSVKIESGDETKALEAVDLLCAAYTVASGYNQYTTEDLLNELHSEEEKQADINFTFCRKKCLVLGADWYFAAKIVSRAFDEQKYKNAICRYHTAHEIIDLHPLDLHPNEDVGQEIPFLTKSIRVSNTIIVCHSILEELGIQVQLRRGEQLIDEGLNTWSGNVIDRCKQVLNNNGIDTSERLFWISRNQMSASDENHAIDRSVSSEDGNGYGTQDFMINIVDGVLELKRLRNKIGAHTLEDRVLTLSLYDAENAFALTRFILLKVFQINPIEELPSLD